MANSFTYDVQMAGYPFDKYDELGEATYEKFVAEFRGFPWRDQVGQGGKGSEATISIKNTDLEHDYFVSVVGEPSKFAYLIGVVYQKNKKSLLGFGRSKRVKWVEIYVAEQPSLVEHSSKLYFAGQINELFMYLKKLPLFLESEASK